MRICMAYRKAMKGEINMKKVYRFTIKQNGVIVAGVESLSFEKGHKEIMYYAMIYLQDGPVKIFQGKRLIGAFTILKEIMA